MRYIVYFFLLSFGLSYSQENLVVQLGPGYFLHHSENDLILLKDKQMEWSYNFALNTTFQVSDATILLAEFALLGAPSQRVLESKYVSDTGEPLGTFGYTYSQNSFLFSLSYIYEYSDDWFVGAGPILTIFNRQLKTNDAVSYDDDLYGYGLGVKLFTFVDYNLQTNGKWFLRSQLNATFLHSIFFDEGNRNLDGYSIYMLESSIQIGLGYRFE
jgi:hypothetical protein